MYFLLLVEYITIYAFYGFVCETSFDSAVFSSFQRKYKSFVEVSLVYFLPLMSLEWFLALGKFYLSSIITFSPLV